MDSNRLILLKIDLQGQMNVIERIHLKLLDRVSHFNDDIHQFLLKFTDTLQAFGLMMTEYQPLKPDLRGVWLPEAALGLGLWQGCYQGVERLWLRWYDQNGQWLLTPTEFENQRADQEKQRADRAEQENARLRKLLQRAGVEF